MDIIEEYYLGRTIRQIANARRVSCSSIYRILKENNVKMRKRGQRYLCPNKEEFKRDCEELRWFELVKKYGVSWQKIKDWKKQFGFTTGKKERRKIIFSEEKNGCWRCSSHKKHKGYPRLKGKLIAKFLWEEKNKKSFPKNAVMRHLCGNKWCINPEHIMPGTQFENILDAVLEGTFVGGLIKKGIREGIIVPVGKNKVKRVVDNKIFVIEGWR